MKRIPVFFALLLMLTTTARVWAEYTFDPAARAKTIAPYIDENSFAVGCIDVSRTSPERLLEVLKYLVEDTEKVDAEIKVNAEKFLQAGGREIFLVGKSLNSPNLFLIVVPLSPSADEKAIRALFPPNVPSRRTGDALLLGNELNGVKTIGEIVPDPRPELETAFKAAGDSAIQLVVMPPKHYRRVIEETMPQLPKEIGGGESTILTRGILWAAVGVDLPPKMSIRLVVQSQDATAAAALRTKTAEILKIASAWLNSKEGKLRLPEMESQLTPEVKKDRLELTLDNREGKIEKILEALGVIATQQRENARAALEIENLKQIGIAFCNYHDINKRFPPPSICDKDGKPLLSWRVAILPQLGLQGLYDKFHLDEPWDSPHNLELSKVAVAVYLSPSMKKNMTPDKKSFLTPYVVPVGPGTVFDTKLGRTYSEISDGTSQTILALQVDEGNAVVWTKPEDLSYSPKEPSKGLSKKPSGFRAVFCDGSVRVLNATDSPDDLRAWFSVNGNDGPKKQ